MMKIYTKDQQMKNAEKTRTGLFMFLVRRKNDKREVFGPELPVGGGTAFYNGKRAIVRCKIAEGYPVPEVDVIVPGNGQKVELFDREKHPIICYTFDPGEFMKDFAIHYTEFSRDFNNFKKLIKLSKNGNYELAKSLVRKLEKTIEFINTVFYEMGYFAVYDMEIEGVKNLVNYVIETHKRVTEEIDIYTRLMEEVKLW